MTYAPKGPFGDVIHEDKEYECQRKCRHKIRTPESKLAQQWLSEHDCDDPYGWKPNKDG